VNLNLTHTDPYRGLIHLQPSQTNLSGARVPQLEFVTDLRRFLLSTWSRTGRPSRDEVQIEETQVQFQMKL